MKLNIRAMLAVLVEGAQRHGTAEAAAADPELQVKFFGALLGKSELTEQERAALALLLGHPQEKLPTLGDYEAWGRLNAGLPAYRPEMEAWIAPAAAPDPEDLAAAAAGTVPPGYRRAPPGSPVAFVPEDPASIAAPCLPKPKEKP